LVILSKYANGDDSGWIAGVKWEWKRNFIKEDFCYFSALYETIQI